VVTDSCAAGFEDFEFNSVLVQARMMIVGKWEFENDTGNTLNEGYVATIATGSGLAPFGIAAPLVCSNVLLITVVDVLAQSL